MKSINSLFSAFSIKCLQLYWEKEKGSKKVVLLVALSRSHLYHIHRYPSLYEGYKHPLIKIHHLVKKSLYP
jgi:hydrogenase/urease accessory protein HupE